eukprot:2461104-Rhodomonas_salina.1
MVGACLENNAITSTGGSLGAFFYDFTITTVPVVIGQKLPDVGLLNSRHCGVHLGFCIHALPLSINFQLQLRAVLSVVRCYEFRNVTAYQDREYHSICGYGFF